MSTADPVTEVSRYGPYSTKHGYVFYQVIYSDRSKATVLAHREVMESHLGRPLTDQEVVHHVDRDPTNNCISNLRLLPSKAAHAKLHSQEDRPSGEVWVLLCEQCGAEFTRAARKERHNKKQGKCGVYCNRRCAARASAVARGPRKYEQFIRLVQARPDASLRELAESLGVSRNTVVNYKGRLRRGLA